jgi:hypothetical protein
MSSGHYWSAQERWFLRTYHRHRGTKELAQLLGRHPTSVRRQARALGLPPQPSRPPPRRGRQRGRD